MFKSVLFDDINKGAFDVMKDGYSFDQKATIKTKCCGCNMSLEGKNFISNMSGKFAIDFKPCTYLTVKKMSIEESGAAVCDIDIPEFLKGTTFMFRSQGNAISRELKKATCGLKYVSENFVSDLVYDVLNEKFTTSAVFSKGNVMVGCKVAGTKDSVSATELAAAYRYKKCVFSAATCENHTAVNAALYVKHFKNVEVGATCKLSLTEVKDPAIAFGCCVKPTTTSEIRTKIGADGKLGLFTKYAFSKNVTLSMTGAADFNNVFKGTHTMGMAMEIRI